MNSSRFIYQNRFRAACAYIHPDEIGHSYILLLPSLTFAHYKAMKPFCQECRTRKNGLLSFACLAIILCGSLFVLLLLQFVSRTSPTRHGLAAPEGSHKERVLS